MEWVEITMGNTRVVVLQKQLPACVRAQRGRLLARLGAYGINDRITVRLRDLTSLGALGLYRSHSQFSRGPIFWLSTGIPALMLAEGIAPHELGRVVFDTLAHEYGHVIAEFGQHCGGALYAAITGAYGTDEEEFAEDFRRFVVGGVGWGQPPEYFQKLLGLYRAAAFH